MMKLNINKGKWNRSTNENDFKFSWNDETSSIIKKINAADSSPGALCKIFNDEYYAYGVTEEEILKGKHGEILAKRIMQFALQQKFSNMDSMFKKKKEGSIKLACSNCFG